jgi:CspA family cold shock protein
VAQGTGKWFGVGKGYGFIAPDDGTPGVFLRKSAIEADGYRNLQDSPRIAYTVTRGSKGPRAEHG